MPPLPGRALAPLRRACVPGAGLDLLDLPAAPGLRHRALRSLREPGRHPLLLAAATALVLESLYLLFLPQAPDLAAQLARAAAASRGAGLWWAGWYGGVNTPPYSLLSGALMAKVGVVTLGVLATGLVSVLGAELLRDARRPRLGAVAVTAAACANLASGRLTFALGMVPALAALVLLRRGRPHAAAVAGALSGLLSPLAAFAAVSAMAGLFLSGSPRRPLVLAAAATCLPVGVVSLLFGQPSTMPFDPWAAFGVVITCVAVALLQVPATVRAVAGVTAVLAVALCLVPSPIGVNVGRLPMLLAAPLVLATVRTDGLVVRLVTLGLLCWPVSNLGMELAIASGPSSSAAYYAPLLEQLPAAGTATQRLELVDTRTHGGAFYVAGQVPLARGWERQVDVAKNPLFYEPTLSPAAYRTWLQAHAVGWVALSSAEPDYGARTEAALVRRGLPFLTPVWRNADWQLFRVTVPAPAATGGLTVTALQDSAVQLRSSGSARGVVRVAYSRVLTVHAEGDPLHRGCVEPGPGGDTVVTVPSAGRWTIEADVGQLLVDCRPGREGVRRALLRRAGGP